MENKDFLDGWREENGIKNSKGEVKHYAGGCEWDATAEAIREYLLEEERKAKGKNKNKDDGLTK